MASQPANSLISVEYTVRSYRQDLLHRSILETQGFPGMRGAVMSTPGEEFKVDETRDNTSSIHDTSLTEGRSTGLPVVRTLVVPTTAAAALTGIANLQMPKRIGRDVFFTKTAAHNTDDIQGQLAAL